MMDRRLKERLVGATILVALIVVVVPELLSGPKPPPSPRAPATSTAPTRTVTVDLSTRKAVGSRDNSGPGAPVAPPGALPGSSPAVAGASASPAPAGTSSPAPSAGAATSVGAAASVGTAAHPLESDTATPRSGSKSGASSGAQNSAARAAWAVQLGSFAAKANAEKLAHQLKSSGIPVYLVTTGSGDAQRFRVRMGPMADRGAAERAAEKLKAQGHAATVVSPVT